MSPVEFIPLGRSERKPRAIWLAPLSILLGSMVTLLPIVATVPFLPPFGLMILLGWRLVRSDSTKVWLPVPLGLFDDMISGQPLGSAMLLWTVCVLVIEVIDTRLVWRDFWQDWLIASGAIAFCLVVCRLVATPFYAHVDTALVVQICVSAAFYPLIARFVAWMDRDTKRR